MKSFFVVAGLSTALLAVAPMAAQARPYTQSGAALSVTVTKTPVRMADVHRGYKAQRGHILPLANVVRQLERRSGAAVTDIQLSKNGKVYNFEGVTKRGFIVKAKANAYTGKVSNVKTTKFRPHYDPKGMPINRLINQLRNKGYQNFDLVSLRDQRGVYVVRGLNRRGKPVQIRVQAKTGRVLSQKATNAYNGPSYVRAQYRDFDTLRPGLERNKFSNFKNVVAYDDHYSANARDAKGQNIALIISAFTGAILSQSR
jgi:uncharacterized membrane protein YkoI